MLALDDDTSSKDYLSKEVFAFIRRMKRGQIEITTGKQQECFKEFLEEIRHATSRCPKEVESKMIHHLNRMERIVNRVIDTSTSDEEHNSVSEVNTLVYRNRSRSPTAASILLASTHIKRKADDVETGINLIRRFK